MKNDTTKKPFFKRWGCLLAILVMIVLIVSCTKKLSDIGGQEIAESTASSKKVAKSNSISISKQAESTKAADEEKDAKDAAALKKMNATISARLKEDKGFADGTLDENGNPTKNGTPNAAFDWANAVYSIKIDKKHYLHVATTEKFAALNDEAKKNVALKSMNLSLSALDENGLATDEMMSEGLFTEVKYGDNVAVQSKVFNHKEFRVY